MDISSRFLHLSLMALLFLFLPACGIMPHSGPGRSAVTDINKGSEPGQTAHEALLVQVDDEVTKKLRDSHKIVPFTSLFKDSKSPAYRIGPGDMVEVSIWETPPALLFKSPGAEGALIAMGTGGETLPPQMVMEDGCITIPFAGRIKVAGRSLAKIEEEIASRLAGKANSPQVLVRISKNAASVVTVIGAVNQSGNLPLSPRGEKLLDALATAGGVAAPLNKVSVQLSRGGKNGRMPLDQIIADPEQNLQLQPGDVITALHQPWSFSILGAAGANKEVPFEAAGISLAEALARSGGLNDYRADPGGVFVFRFEDARLFPERAKTEATANRVPVIYQINFNEPATFFVTQNFPMQDKDVVYIANMPTAELQKFMQMVGMVLSPTLSIGRYQMSATQ